MNTLAIPHLRDWRLSATYKRSVFRLEKSVPSCWPDSQNSLGSFCFFFCSYLKNRVQPVVVVFCVFLFCLFLFYRWRPFFYFIVIYGVPQGSVFGPVLFYICISDVPLYILFSSAGNHMFADDTTLHKTGEREKRPADGTKSMLITTRQKCQSGSVLLRLLLGSKCNSTSSARSHFWW